LKFLVHTSRKCCKPQLRLYFWLQNKQHTCQSWCHTLLQLEFLSHDTCSPGRCTERIEEKSSSKNLPASLDHMRTYLKREWVSPHNVNILVCVRC
jgi:hypothetical protein